MSQTENIYEDIYHRRHECRKEIKRGGQGAVYRTAEPDIAVKLELKNNEPVSDTSGNQKFLNLRLLPIPSGLHVTLPRSVLANASGYTMSLLEDMTSFEEFFCNQENLPENAWVEETFSGDAEISQVVLSYLATGGTRRRLQAYAKAAGILTKLHENGLVYCDISPNNLFISSDLQQAEPEVWFIDADNINFRENIDTGCGTPGYFAPEARCRGKFSFASDCYSFAVLLFQQLTGLHPFKGEAYDNNGWDQGEAYNNNGEEKNDKLLDRGEFPWILDEDDDTNKINPIFEHSLLIPENLMELFRRTFSQQGKTKPASRPAMAEWLETLGDALDRTVQCPKCCMNYLAALPDFPVGQCPWCDNQVPLLRVRSFDPADDTAGSPIREFYREITVGNDIRVPERAAGGLPSDGEEAFVLSKKAGAYRFRSLTDRLTFRRADSGIYRTVDGELSVNTLPLILESQDKRDGFSTRLEIEVIR